MECGTSTNENYAGLGINCAEITKKNIIWYECQ